MDQIVAINQQSKNCEQFVKYKFRKVGFLFITPYSWWVARNGTRMTYWGGAKPNSAKCACGMTNICLIKSQPCNCDQKNNVWTEDSGLLIDKNALPVIELRFGDTSKVSGKNEIGYTTQLESCDAGIKPTQVPGPVLVSCVKYPFFTIIKYANFSTQNQKARYYLPI